MRAGASFEKARRSAHGRKGANRAVDAAGDYLLGACDQPPGLGVDHRRASRIWTSQCAYVRIRLNSSLVASGETFHHGAV
jgi:hypothetical protein